VQIASIVIYADIESGSEQSAAALSVLLMVVALVVLFAIRRVGGRVGH
jgi:ABC-type sulfate transport system permease component